MNPDTPFEEMVAADIAIEELVTRGNSEPLIERLRNAKVLLPAERALIADVLDGKFKRPAHRPGDPDQIAFRNMFLALSVRVEQDRAAKEGGHDNRQTAVQKVAQSNNVSVSLVNAAVAENPDMFTSFVPRRKRATK